MGKPKVLREQWLDKGVELFDRYGLKGLNVEAMAKELGSAKSGFYWYFKTRDAFFAELLEHWERTETAVVIGTANAEKTPARRIITVCLQVVERTIHADFLSHLRDVARTDENARAVLEEVEGQRIGFVNECMTDFGYEQHEALRMARFLYHYFLGWHQRHKYTKLTPAHVFEELATISKIIGFDLAASSE